MTLPFQRPANSVHWVRLIAIFAAFLIVSFGLGILLDRALMRFRVPLHHSALLAYLAIFIISLVVNLSVLPLPFAISIMIVAATIWNPVIVALLGSLGATFGEFSSYFVGRFGKRIAALDDTLAYRQMQSWILRYGVWAIAVLSFQPIIPFELGGFVAGVTRMSIPRFLLALWIGKFPKYLLLIYAGRGIIHLVPFLSP